MIRSIFTFAILIIVCSCTKELPYPQVENADVLVMNGLMSPEGGAMVHLSQSCHVTDIDCKGKTIDDAQVNLYDNNGLLVTELSHSSNGLYQTIDFNIEPGQSYNIEAISTEYSTIKANTKTPNPVNWELLSVDEDIYLSYLCRTFEIEIEDDPSEENYYLIHGYVDILNGQHDEYIENELNNYLVPHTGFLSDNINTENTSLTSNTDYIALPLDYVFLPDENFSGEKYRLKFGLHDYDLMSNPNFELRTHIKVKSVSKELYEFYKSMALYRLTLGSFLTEPVQIFSNVENGLGIFGGFSELERSIDLPKSEYWYNGNMTVENEGCTAPCTVRFSAEMGSKVNFIWDFGDGSTSTEMNPEHIYSNSGEYQVSLSVSFGNTNYLSDQTIRIN